MPQPERKYRYKELTSALWHALLHLRQEFAHAKPAENQMTIALANELKKQGLSVSIEVPVVHRQNGKPIGIGYMDLLIDGRVVVEVKNVQTLSDEHLRQLRRYVDDSGKLVGVLINFGGPDPDWASYEDRRNIFRRYDVPDPETPRKR